MIWPWRAPGDRQPLSGVEALSASISDSLSPIHVIDRLLLIAAALSAVLEGQGIYGVLGHSVGSRRRGAGAFVLGVRFALATVFSHRRFTPPCHDGAV